ncbi:hypothetical protein ACP4OV_027672 [Aristida adscensionis]
MQANGFLFWEYKDRRHMVSLDTRTMHFSVCNLPQRLRDCTFDVGATKDGIRIVYTDQFCFNVGFLLCTRDVNGVESWVPERVVNLKSELKRVLPGPWNFSELDVLAVRDDHVYLVPSMLHDPQAPCWFLSLCLETMKVEKLFQRTYDNHVHPYIMAWPSLKKVQVVKVENWI